MKALKAFRAWALLVIVMSMNLIASWSHAGQAYAANVTDHTIDLPGGKVFYRDSGGNGVPLVLLHAASGNSMLWEYQVPAFTAAGYRFIAIDYRGVGANGGNNAPALIHELTGKLKLDKFHLLGTAAGGGVALQYALLHPERLRSVIVVNSIGAVQDKEYAELGNRLRPAPIFNQLPLEFRELGPSYRAANPEGVKRWLSLSSVEPPPLAPPGAPGMAPPGGTSVTWAKLEILKVPTLLMTGDADLYAPPSVLRLFAAHLKQAETAIIPESGHSSYWENPDIFNRTVLAFVSKH